MPPGVDMSAQEPRERRVDGEAICGASFTVNIALQRGS